MRRTRGRAAAALAGLAIALATGPAAAQINGAPNLEPLVERPTLNAEQVDEVAAYVEALVGPAASADVRARSAARRALLDPLLTSRGRASLAFRQAYERAVRPLLDRLAASEDVADRVYACALAAELATPRTLDLLLERLGDPSPAVRFAAVSRTGRFFDRVGRDASAADRGSVIRAMDRLEEVAVSGDNVMYEAGVRALLEAADAPAGTLTRRGQAELADEGLRRAVAIGTRRLGEAGVSAPRADIAAHATIAAMFSRQVQPGGNAFDADSVAAVARFAGDLLAFVFRLDKAGFRVGTVEQPVDVRPMAELIAAEAWNVIFFADQRFEELGVDDRPELPANADPAQALRSDQLGPFRQQIVQLVGKDIGLLRQPPYNLPQSRGLDED